MNTITYGIVEDHFILGDIMRVSYGLAAYADACIVGAATIVDSVHDLTDSKSQAESLAEECNRGHLSLCHFKDVIEDFLAR